MLPGVEKRAIVVRPFDIGGDIRYVVADPLPGFQVDHRDRVETVATCIDTERRQLVVWRHGKPAQRKVGMPFGQLVAVQQQFFGRVQTTELAAVERIFAFRLIAVVIKVIAIANGRRCIIRHQP